MNTPIFLMRCRPLLVALLTMWTLGAAGQTFDRAHVLVGVPDVFCQDVAVGRDGSYYVVGEHLRTITIGAFTLVNTDTTASGQPTTRVFVAKFDSLHTCLWAAPTSKSADGYASGTAIALDSTGNAYVAGQFSAYSLTLGTTQLYNSSQYNDLFVARLNGRTGQWEWARRAGGRGDETGVGLKADNANHVYLTCLSGGDDSVRFGSNVIVRAFSRGADCFLTRLDASTGTWQWVANTSGSERGRRAFGDPISDGRGHILVAGSFASPVMTLGHLTFHSTYSNATFPSGYRRRGFIASLDEATGQWQWAIAVGDTARSSSTGCYFSDLVRDSVGNLYVAGGFTSPTLTIGATTLTNAGGVNPAWHPNGDAIVAKLDTAHNWVWAISAGGRGNEGVNGLELLTDSRLYIAGMVGSGSVGLTCGSTILTPRAGFTTDIYGGELDPATGAWRGAFLTGNRDMFLQKMWSDPRGRLHLLGFSRDSLTHFDPFVLAHTGQASYFLARLGQGPLAVPAQVSEPVGLSVWPNPAPRAGAVWVSGLRPGQRAQVLDLLGRVVVRGQMPVSGPLRLGLPAALAAGTYLVRGVASPSAPPTAVRRLVVE